MAILPEARPGVEQRGSQPDFETMIAGLPEAQKEVVTMLKVGGHSLEEVARATSSTVGAVKQKAHRAYEKLRAMLPAPAGYDVAEEKNELP